MKRLSRFPLMVVVFYIVGGFIPIVRAEPISIFVSALPQKYFVERVGGDRVQVSVMVGPGQSPATYEPTPQQMSQLNRAQVYVRIGLPFENVWMARIVAANPKMRVIDAREGIRLREMAQHSYEAVTEHASTYAQVAEHPHGKYDPHVWTAPPLVQIMAARIRDLLIDLDPDHRKEYQRNYSHFATDLDELHQAIQQMLDVKKERQFMVFHPAWGYFAATYGLTQIPIESEGKEPGAKGLAHLIEQAKKDKVRVIFVQKQFSRRNAETVARAIGAKVVAVDPLAENYIKNLRFVAKAFAENMR